MSQEFDDIIAAGDGRIRNKSLYPAAIISSKSYNKCYMVQVQKFIQRSFFYNFQPAAKFLIETLKRRYTGIYFFVLRRFLIDFWQFSSNFGNFQLIFGLLLWVCTQKQYNLAPQRLSATHWRPPCHHGDLNLKCCSWG